MFHSPIESLASLLGESYLQSVIAATDALGILERKEADNIAHEKIPFYPPLLQQKQEQLLEKIGTKIINSFENAINGAATAAFQSATHKNASPLTGIGNMRVGENGVLYLIGKSEHYHASLGHQFNGYKLIDQARKLGILNATHNNTRGYITRLLEQELIRSIYACSESELLEILQSHQPKVLNRVINLETGSVAVEAGVKMMLTRFYRLDNSFPTPPYAGKIPVFFVIADNSGTKEANYHGTSITTQTFRGMWPELYDKIEQAELYRVVSVKINDITDFQKKMTHYNQGKYKTAGFLHEIVLMNYGAILLEREYLQQAYQLCKETETPILVDEIQSCMWYPGMFLFKCYGLHPDFVVIGKGFPGGEYPASKIITTYEMDTLNQFGALVTNGQEELASLSYLVTMKFATENASIIAENGTYFHNRLQELGRKYPTLITKVEGLGHCGALHFETLANATAFAEKLNEQYIDSSAQVYKPNCPPAVLLKPTLIASKAILDYICDKMDHALLQLNCGETQ